jgi:hypothetical protein
MTNNPLRKSFVIAIQPDDNGPSDSSSPIWSKILRDAGHEVRTVNVFSADILAQLQGCEGLMWRHIHHPDNLQVSRRLLPVLERTLRLPIYPNQNTCWHYDDKIAQHYLFKVLDIPAPNTWVWFDKDLALAWATKANYPLVAKLSGGAGSDNVVKLESFIEAERLIAKLFGDGVRTLQSRKEPLGWGRGRLLKSMKMTRRALRNVISYALLGKEPGPEPTGTYWELHKNYILCQEFLAGNEYDTRITVIGNRAFGFRRFNRPNDFRASGSGRIDWNPAQIDPAFIELSFETAAKLKMQSCALDFLRRGKDPIICEVSYTFGSKIVHACPGHWDSDLKWHDGQMLPEEAEISDFLSDLG